MKNFIKSNLSIIFVEVIYYILLFILFQEVFIEIFLLHLFLIGIALTPISEYILRLLNGANPISAERDRNHLESLFEEVYEVTKEKYPFISKKIKLYKSKEILPNAYALGRNTIALTKGVIDAFSDSELKGVIAHELGHLANGNTQMLLVMFVSSIVVSSVLLMIELSLTITSSISSAINSDSVGSKALQFIKKIVVFLTKQLVLIFLAFGSRKSEYLADSFAYSVGYGEELKTALIILSNMDFKKNISILSILKESHPDIDNRIARLEEMQKL